MFKAPFLGYAGRYIRRLPIVQNRILKVTGDEVVYLVKDTIRAFTNSRRVNTGIFLVPRIH